MGSHNNLILDILKKIEKIVKGIKDKDFNKIAKHVLEKIKKDKEFISNETNIKKIIDYFQKKCLTQEGINGVGLVLSQPKKKSSIVKKTHKGGSGMEIYALGLLGAATAWYVLDKNFCKWYPDKCTKEADGTIKEPTPAEKTEFINEMCMNPENPFMKVACLGAPETPSQIKKAKIQNKNITNFVDVIENNTIVVNVSNITISETPETSDSILLHDLIVNVTSENEDSSLNFSHLIPKVVDLSKPTSKPELITWVKEQVKTVPHSQIAKWITRSKKFRVNHTPLGIHGPEYKSVWSGPGGKPERFLSAKLQQLIDTKGGFIDGKFHPKGIEWIQPPTSWSKKGKGNTTIVKTRTQRFPKKINTKGRGITGTPRPKGITHVKPSTKPYPPLPPFVSNSPLSIFGIASNVVTKLSQTNNGNLHIWIALVMYTFGIILSISILMKTVNYMFKKQQPELEWTLNTSGSKDKNNYNLKERLNSKLEVFDPKKELFPGFDNALKTLEAEDKKIKKMKAKSGKNAAAVGLTKLLKHEKAELEKALRQTKRNHKKQMTKMVGTQVAKRAIQSGIDKASKKALNEALRQTKRNHKKQMTKMVAKHAANTASKKASQKALTQKYRQTMTTMVGTHASLKASKKSLEKEIELKFADFANKLNASLQTQSMFSEAIQQGSFNIQQLMAMLQQNVSEKQALEDQIEELNQTVTELKDESDAQRDILEEQDLRIEELSSEIGLKDEEIEYLKEILSVDNYDTSAEIALHNKDEIDMLEREIQDLQSQSPNDNTDNRIQKLEELSRSIKNNDQNISAKYTELINEFLVLTKLYNDLTEELKTKNNEIQENQETIVVKETEISELKKKIRHLVIKVNEFGDSKVQNEDAKASLKKDILSHLETIKQNEAEIKGLKTDNDELYEVNSENSTKLISQNEEIQKLTDDFNTQTEKLDGSQIERAELVDLNEALKAENVKLKVISEKYNEFMQDKEELEAEQNEINRESKEYFKWQNNVKKAAKEKEAKEKAAKEKAAKEKAAKEKAAKEKAAKEKAAKEKKRRNTRKQTFRNRQKIIWELNNITQAEISQDRKLEEIEKRLSAIKETSKQKKAEANTEKEKSAVAEAELAELMALSEVAAKEK